MRPTDGPQFRPVQDDELTPDQLRQVRAVRAEMAATKRADAGTRETN